MRGRRRERRAAWAPALAVALLAAGAWAVMRLLT